MGTAHAPVGEALLRGTVMVISAFSDPKHQPWHEGAKFPMRTLVGYTKLL